MSKKNKNQKNQEEKKELISNETKKSIFIICLVVLALIVFLSLFSFAGPAGRLLNSLSLYLFGWTRFVLPLFIVFLALLAAKKNLKFSWMTYLGIFLFLLSLNGLLHFFADFMQHPDLIAQGRGGGYLGYAVSLFLYKIMGLYASLIVLGALLIVSLLLILNTSIFYLIKTIFPFGKTEANESRPLFNTKPLNDPDEAVAQSSEKSGLSKEPEEEILPKDDDKVEPASDKNASKNLLTAAVSKFKFKKGNYDLPLDLLTVSTGKPNGGDIKANSHRIKKTFENFGITVEMGEVKVGPTVTQFTLKPAEGIKLSRITALNDNLALALAAHPIRIEAPIPGKSLIGIEVPNKSIACVSQREMLESPDFLSKKSKLMIALGKDVSGKVWSADLATMPHLLVAGATGSGKSVCLNSIIVSLIYQNSPETLRFILVDPKRVEFPVYNGIPHLLTPVITDVTKTVNALKWTISEMDRRFDVLANSGKRNIESYNKTNEEKIPYLVLIIDELADLMVAAAAEVEACIIRLTQMARAVGIHLVLATQRPSVDVITGLIKANVPARIAFSVASLMDSRTILDCAGAEKLVGKGDMLFINAEIAKPRRMQGSFLSDEEIKNVVRYLKDNLETPAEYNEEIVVKQKGGHTSFDYDNNDDDDDDLVEDAKQEIIRAGKASASLLQRRLRIGYARAARLLDILEEKGFIGPASGAKPREILENYHNNNEPPHSSMPN